jgi:hypothetical protein
LQAAPSARAECSALLNPKLREGGIIEEPEVAQSPERCLNGVATKASTR